MFFWIRFAQNYMPSQKQKKWTTPRNSANNWQFWIFGPNLPKKDIFSWQQKNRTFLGMVVTYYSILFCTGANRRSSILMSLFLVVTETIKQYYHITETIKLLIIIKEQWFSRTNIIIHHSSITFNQQGFFDLKKVFMMSIHIWKWKIGQSIVFYCKLGGGHESLSLASFF